MRPIRLFWTLACLLLSAEAVKEHLFKDCEKSGFCRRNRHYASQIARAGASNLPYTIDKDTISLSETHIQGSITKALPENESVKFLLDISVLDGDALRIKIDENRNQIPVKMINTKRYNGAIDAAFDGPPSSKTQNTTKERFRQNSHGFTYTFGPGGTYSLKVEHYPVKFTIYKKGEPQVVINEKSFLNIEHFRKESDKDSHINRDLELDFDMFYDSFEDSKGDTKPLGPESVAVDISLPGFSHVYGIPEHADSLSLKDTTETKWPYRLYNVDIFEYETDSRMPMYGSIPLLVGVKPDAAVGLFWINAADTFVDLKNLESVTAHWISESGVLDVVVILGQNAADINMAYGLLTGYAPLPQEFALGYHQCRWNYNDVKDVLDISAKMDKHRFPFDTVWLDLEYTHHKQYYTWDPNNFGQNVQMMQELDATGRNLVVLIDPHLKTGYYVSNYVEKHGIGIKDAGNSTYKGHCWPGESVWIDSMNPLAQGYWDTLFALSAGLFLSQQTNVHLWNDMNEPSMFNGPETTSPKDNMHYSDVEHRSVHNLWGKSFHELTHKLLVKRLENTSRQRPFILTRSYFAGSQRTAAMWTGDNMAKWEYLRASLPMVLTSNVVNMPFAGADVGGFFGDPSKELLTRWYQAGIWYPFFRAHAHIDSRRREPWIAGEPYTSIMRDAVRLRYALLPTLYTLFHKTSLDGSPVWRPMFYDTPKDPETYEIEDQFFMGQSGILVKPVTAENAAEVSVYIPSDDVYYDYTNGKFSSHPKVMKAGHITKTVGLSDIPVFVRGGSIFARRDRYRRSSRLMRKDPYSLVVAFGKTQQAHGRLYIDDGESYGYKEGKYVKVFFDAIEGTKIRGTLLTGDPQYASSLKDLRIEKVTIVGSNAAASIDKVKITQGGKTWDARARQNGDVIEVLNPEINVVTDWTIDVLVQGQDRHDEL